MSFRIDISLVFLLMSFVPAHGQSCLPEVYAQTGGDVILGGFFNLHTMSHDGQDCGSLVDMHAIQRLEAFFFAVDLINSVSFVPGIRFGVMAYDTCGLGHVATQKALHWLAEKNYVGDGKTCDILPIHLGAVGPMYTGPAKDIAILLTSARMTQISYNAGGSSVDDREKYPYFLRTGPNGLIASKVILDIIQEYGWSDLIVITGQGVDEQDRRKDLYQIAGSNGVCVVLEITVDAKISNFTFIIKQLEAAVDQGVIGVVVLTLPKPTEIFFGKVQSNLLPHPKMSKLRWVMGLPFTDSVVYNNLKDTIKGMITFNIHPQPVRGFKEYFTSLLPTDSTRNPWFRKFWEQTFNCTMNKTCHTGHVATYRQTYRQASGTAQTVAAVYAYAQGFKDAHRDVCGQNYTGVCPALASISTDRWLRYLYKSTFVNLDGQIVSFDKNGDLASPIFSIYNVQLDGVAYSLRKIGTWSETKGLRLKSRIKVYDVRGKTSDLYPTSRCKFVCLCKNQLEDDRYGIMEGGDFLLQGIFDTHGGNAALEASAHLGGRPIGDLSLVSECGGQPHPEAVMAMEALYYAIDLVNEDKDILQGVTLGATTFDACRSPKRAVRHTTNLLSGMVKIPLYEKEIVRPIATIEATTSDVSKSVAKLLGPHKITQISSSATATELDDKSEYPFFLRTTGAGFNQVQAVVDILNTFNWTYVKVIYSDNAYGNSAMNDFNNLVDGSRICVATQVQLDDHLAHNAKAMKSIVQYYFLEAYVDAKVVVMFVTDRHATKVMHSLRTLVGTYRSHDLVWIATDQWGTKPSVTYGYEDLIEGAITLDFIAEPVPDFLAYYRALKPWTNDRNPWFAEFWQYHFGCFLTGDYARIFNTSCDPSTTLHNEHIIMSTQVPLVIDAVYATALGLHNLLIEHCGTNYSRICRRAKLNIHNLHEYIKQMHFYNGITNTAVSFDKLGSTVPRYQIFNYRQIAHNVYNYHKVGKWELGNLILNKKDVYAATKYNNSVYSKSIKSECLYSENQPCFCSSKEVTNLKYELQYERLTLLGYFPIHESSDGGECSHVRSKEGFETLMAFKYAIERVNRDPHLLGNITLGYMIFDTCSNPDKAKIAFNAFDRSLRFFSQTPQLPVITYVHAFIGGFEDSVSKALHQASVSGQHLVQISPGSSSVSLSDKAKYERFLRTIAPEMEKARALVALIKSLEWSYVGLVYDQSERDLELHDLIEKVMYENGLCIAAKLPLAEPEEKKTYDGTVRKLLAAKGAVGVIVIASKDRTVSFLQALQRNKAIGRFVLIGTDLWGPTDILFRGYEEPFRGAFVVLPDTRGDPYYDAYMRRLSLEHYGKISPWFREYWQDFFKCDLSYGGRFGRACTGLESLENGTFSSNPFAINAINAVYAYAYGLSRLFHERCGGVVIPPCDMLLGGKQTSALVYDYIKNVKFTGADGNLFRFTGNADGPGKFKVLNYQIERFDEETKEKIQDTGYTQVGVWVKGELHFNLSAVQMYNTEGKIVAVKSECPGTCNCSKSDVLFDSADVALTFNAHNTIWGILVLTFISLGCGFSLIIILFFILKFKHPVVDGASCSLSVLLLMAIIFLYILNFSFMVSETHITCGIRRFGLGLLYVTIVNILLIKSVRIFRISQAAGNDKPVFVGGPSQCLAVLLLSSIQLVLACQWLIIDPPNTESYLHDVSEEGHYPVYIIRWRCSHSRAGLVASNCYVFLMLLISIIVSSRTIRTRGFQFEALFIFASLVFLAVSLFIWALIYTLVDEGYSNSATCLCNTLNASAVLALIFCRKMLVLTAASNGKRDYNDPYDESFAVPRRDKSSVARGKRSRSVQPIDSILKSFRGPRAPDFQLSDGYM